MCPSTEAVITDTWASGPSECGAVRGRRIIDPLTGDPEWVHDEYPLDANVDRVHAWSGGEWVALQNARLIGTPCGALTAYASVGADLYGFDEGSQRWVPSNADWPLVQGSPLCRTTYPELPLPPCSCP